MMYVKMKCKHCGSSDTYKNGHKKNWKNGRRYRVQMWKCNHCGRTTMGARRYE